MPALLHDPPPSDLNLFCGGGDRPPPSALADAVAYALHKCPGFQFLPSNYDDAPLRNGPSASAHFSCDDFRMYEFKVRRCMRGRSHDWTECPFAHPGEKARRRDPRRIHYSGTPCPDFRKGSCRRGDACEFAHGVFECWLHPARYRTQECKDGKSCKRRVCFFAHSPEQLRILPESSASTTQAEKGYVCTGGPFVEALSISKGFSANVSSPNSSVGMPKTRQISPAVMIPAPPLTPHSPVQVNPLALHQDLTNLSGFSRAAIQNALACKAYGVNLNAAEYSPLLDGYESFPEVHAPCVPHINMQQAHFWNCLDESLFTKFNLPSENSYEFPSYSHGFTSPTSTLAGHVFSPPPLSPPLSPLTTSNTNGIRQLISNPANDCNGSFVINTDETFACQNQSYIEDLGFHLQNLCIASGNNVSHADQILCEAVQAGQSVNIAQQLKPSPVKNSVSDPSCRRTQAVWGHANKFACSDIWQAGEFAAQELGMSKNGEESISDNFAPDFGWVSELVK